MKHRILNRFNQTEIAEQFADFTDNYLKKNQFKANYKRFFIKIIIAVIIYHAFNYAIKQKDTLAQNTPKLSMLVSVLVIIVFVYYKLEVVHNGILIGEYNHKNQRIVFKLSYTTESSKYELIQKKEGITRIHQFNYYNYVDESGRILENNYEELLSNFINQHSEKLEI